MISADKSSTHRYASLDCLRGLAAFIVLTTHVLSMDRINPEQMTKPIAWLFMVATSGTQAVILFFVLSGFSLFILFESLTQLRFPSLTFISARWLRLFPVYIFSIVFSIIVHWALSQANFTWEHVNIKNWTRGFFITGSAFSAVELLKHALMIGRFDWDSYNHPIWSIVHEMRISILFPVLFYAVKKLRAYSVLISVLLAVGNDLLYIGRDLREFIPYCQSYVASVDYAMFFVWGAAIALYRNGITNFVLRCSKIKLLLVIGISVLLYITNPIPMKNIGHLLLQNDLVGVGSCGLIIATLALPAIAEISILRWLGKISYSLYLMHYTCISAVFITLNQKVSFSALCVLTIALSLLLSDIVWRVLERPSLNLSRRVRRTTVPDSTQALWVYKNEQTPLKIIGKDLPK